MAAYRRVYDSRHPQTDCQNCNQLRNPTLGNRVWATFTFFYHTMPCQQSISPLAMALCLSMVAKYMGTEVRDVTLPHRYGNSHAICDHTVLPATRQRWHSHLYPSQSWYSIWRSRRAARLGWQRHCRKAVQPMPKTAYHSGICDEHNRPRCDSNLGPLTPQLEALTTRSLPYAGSPGRYTYC